MSLFIYHSANVCNDVIRKKNKKKIVKNVRLRVMRELKIKKKYFLTMERYAVERRGRQEDVRCSGCTQHPLQHRDAARRY